MQVSKFSGVAVSQVEMEDSRIHVWSLNMFQFYIKQLYFRVIAVYRWYKATKCNKKTLEICHKEISARSQQFPNHWQASLWSSSVTWKSLNSLPDTHLRNDIIESG